MPSAHGRVFSAKWSWEDHVCAFDCAQGRVLLSRAMSDTFRTEHDKLRRAGTRSGLVAAVILFGVAKGISMERFAEVTGLSMADLVDPDARVPDEALGAAWRLIGEHFPNEAPALEMAAAAPLSVFGPFAQAARYSATRREALATFARYHKALSGGLEMLIEEDSEELVLTLCHTQDEVDDGHGAESGIALGARMGRDVLEMSDAVLRVEFRHQPHGPEEVYHEHLGAEVAFGAQRNAVVFSAASMQQAPSQPDPAMYQYIDSHLKLVEERLLEQLADEPLDEVRSVIAKLAHQSEYGAEALASEMGMSLRSLQRFTRKHGASVKELIDAQRQANACRLLGDRRISVDQVAFLVGYSEESAFRRAFQRWTGQSPSQFRERAG